MKGFLGRRVQDGVITRLVAKWLKAGVWEKGQVSYPENGTPQGGVISPLLSNIYLHEVLDKWFVQSVRPACGGGSFMVRFADDFVMGFERLEDAQKVRRVLAKRLGAVRTGDQRGENAVGALRAAAAWWCGRRRQAGDIRLPWLHPLLGQVAPRQLGGAEENRQVAVSTGAALDQGMGVETPPPALERSSSTNSTKSCAVMMPTTGSPAITRMLAELRRQVAKLWREWLGRRNRGQTSELGTVQRHAAGLPLNSCKNRPLCHVMNPQSRGTVCLNWARTDLWGASPGLRAGRPYPGNQKSTRIRYSLLDGLH